MNYRKAITSDIAGMEQLILTEGPNEWNHLPEDEVREHLRDIATGETEAVLAEMETDVQDAPSHNRIVGFVSYVWGQIYPQYEPAELKDKDHGYVSEAVVHRDFAGRGIGSRLLRMSLQELAEKGFKRVYAHRHEENLASAKMMEKTGFEIVDTFYDPERRPHGSRNTTVCRYVEKSH